MRQQIKNYTMTKDNFTIHFGSPNYLSCPRLINDIASVENHVRGKDYFGTLATIIDLISQTEESSNDRAETMKNLKNELMYLQKNYKIVRK